MSVDVETEPKTTSAIARPVPTRDPESHDPWVHRLAVAGVSGALIAFLLAGAIIGAAGEARTMGGEYWTLGAALAGALVGIIAPSPRQKREEANATAPQGLGVQESHKNEHCCTRCWNAFRPMIQPLLLLCTLVLSLWIAPQLAGHAADAAVLHTLAAGAAGGLLGLLVPNTARQGGG